VNKVEDNFGVLTKPACDYLPNPLPNWGDVNATYISVNPASAYAYMSSFAVSGALFASLSSTACTQCMRISTNLGSTTYLPYTRSTWGARPDILGPMTRYYMMHNARNIFYSLQLNGISQLYVTNLFN
jgi:hypothetical protein